jgi:hypothetical protein
MDEQTLQRLVDRQDISDLLVRYWELLDGREVDRLGREYFTEDAIDEYDAAPMSFRAEGWDQIRAFLTTGLRSIDRYVHDVNNVAVDVRGDEATAKSHSTAWTWLAGPGDPDRPADLVTVGHVEDHLRRTPQGWRAWRRSTRRIGFGVGSVERAQQAVAGADSAEG